MRKVRNPLFHNGSFQMMPTASAMRKREKAIQGAARAKRTIKVREFRAFETERQALAYGHTPHTVRMWKQKYGVQIHWESQAMRLDYTSWVYEASCAEDGACTFYRVRRNGRIEAHDRIDPSTGRALIPF